MPLVDMGDMLHHAYQEKYAVGAFDLVSLDFLEGIIIAAEKQRAPVIISLAESHFEYFDFDLAMAATVAAARRCLVPVAIHLDHGASLQSAERGIRLGCNGVMVDSSNVPFEQNVASTRAITDMAHACGVYVEGELGYVAGVEGEDADKHPGEVVYTSVEEAASYVARTQVDCLAVSIGTVHGRMRGTPHLDFDRLARINDAIKIPLVIHGGTGLADEQYRQLIARGVTKINYYTALADAAGAQIRANAAKDARCGYTGLVRGVREAIAAECERMIVLFGSAGRADAILKVARPWREVAHVIIYNTNDQADSGEKADPNIEQAGIEHMMAAGHAALSNIPGVRQVVTGRAIKDQAQYQYCWLIRFAQPAVIKSYREHPAHIAFADQHFRPRASDRISIDYELIDP